MKEMGSEGEEEEEKWRGEGGSRFRGFARE